MTAFEIVSGDTFRAVLDAAPATDLFRQQYARYRPEMGEEAGWTDFQVHRGDVEIDGDFTAPGYCTLIIGNLSVTGYVDLRNPYERNFDEGGLFIVLGDVRCRVFAGEGGKCSFVDGNLTARDLVFNAYIDSSLVITGALTTRFFYGLDIWADVGTGADMEYGVGYASSIRPDGKIEPIYPRNDEAASLALLDCDDPDETNADELMQRVREGKPVLLRPAGG